MKKRALGYLISQGKTKFMEFTLCITHRALCGVEISDLFEKQGGAI